MLPWLANVIPLYALVALTDAAAIAPSVQTRVSSPQALHEIQRRLHEIRLNKRQNEVFSRSISLEKSFTNAVLLSGEVDPANLPVPVNLIPGTPSDDANPPKDAPANTPQNGQEEAVTGGAISIEVVCSRCYTKGLASATLDIEGGVNPATLFDASLDAVEEAVADTIGQLTDWIGDIDFDFSDFDLRIPAPDVDFNVDLNAFPDTVLDFRIDNLEMFIELETTLSGGINHEIPLFRSVGLGLELTPDLFLGLVFGVDLILAADAEVSLTNGFHLALEDSASLKVALFSEQATDFNFNGGRFEFLPVTIDSAQGTIRAILQLSLRAGFELSPPDLIPGLDLDLDFLGLGNLSASAGVETLVFANVADLLTTIEADFTPEAECALNIKQEYTLAVGAAAGATVALGEQVFGPTASTEIPIFTATIADICAINGPAASPTASPGPPVAPFPIPGCNQTLPTTTPALVTPEHPALTESTLTRTATQTVIECHTTGLAQCPASMQTLRRHIVIETVVTTVSAGAHASMPETTGSTVSTTARWGKDAQDFLKPEPTPCNLTKREIPGLDEVDIAAEDEESPLQLHVLLNKTSVVNRGFMIQLGLALSASTFLTMAGFLILYQRRSMHNDNADTNDIYRYQPAMAKGVIRL